MNAGTTGTCYQDNVVGPGSPKYDEAYFEIDFLRAYTTGGPAPTPASAGIELGSTVCKPRDPSCAACPLRPTCKAYIRHSEVSTRRIPRGSAPGPGDCPLRSDCVFVYPFFPTSCHRFAVRHTRRP